MIMAVECPNCYGLGKQHSHGCNGDPDDDGVDCERCNGAGVIDVDCETGDEIEDEE